MKFFWLGSALVLSCLLFGIFLWFNYSLKPVSTQDKPVTFVVNSGDPASLIMKNLKAQNLIRSYSATRIFYQFKAENTVFRPGVYYLSADKSVTELFTVITSGPKDVKVTFPEGWRREQYAARLAAAFPGFAAEEFLKLTATLEGQLFPDTYYLPASPSPQKVIPILTANFTRKSGLTSSQKDLLIVASLVERESNNPKDSGLIAGIILKRLKNGWPLQIDATVQYARDTQNCKNMVLSCDYWTPVFDTKFTSVYNTYLKPGLPPHPIANPGLASIQAVLRPIESDYWFYLTGNDGQTYFAKDLAAHQKLVDTHLKL